MGSVDRTQRNAYRDHDLQAMMLFARLTYVGVLLFLLAGTTRGQSSIDSTLQMVESLYTSGAYPQAELEARRMLESDLLGDSVHVVVEQWVAFALVAQGRPALAKEHFMNILRRRPSYELDVILTSPKILAVFNETRAAFRAAQTPEIDSRPVPEIPRSEGITFRTILFPGWEQWHYGRTTVGALFIGAGIATLGTGIALEFMRSSARREYLSATAPADIETKYRTYNRTSKAEGYAFATFAVVYLTSEIDVFTCDSPVSISYRPANLSNPGNGLLLSFCIR